MSVHQRMLFTYMVNQQKQLLKYALSLSLSLSHTHTHTHTHTYTHVIILCRHVSATPVTTVSMS
jgi:hypothetical protein